VANLQCIVVTPEATVRDEPADFVAVPLYDGELGVAPGHSPMIGRLGYGELRMMQDGQATRYYVDGGFVQVADNVVSILTPRAIAADDLDAAVAREDLETARQMKANSPELMARRDRLVAQSRAQLRLVGRTDD